MGRPESRPAVSVLYSGVSRLQEQLLNASIWYVYDANADASVCVNMNAEGYISDKMGRKFGMVIINESPSCLTLLRVPNARCSEKRYIYNQTDVRRLLTGFLHTYMILP